MKISSTKNIILKIQKVKKKIKYHIFSLFIYSLASFGNERFHCTLFRMMVLSHKIFQNDLKNNENKNGISGTVYPYIIDYYKQMRSLFIQNRKLNTIIGFYRNI